MTVGVINAVPSGWACSACRSGLPTFSPHIVISTNAFSSYHNDGWKRTMVDKKKRIYRAPRARSVLINGRSACEEPPLRHLLRWAVELQWQRCFFFLLSSHFIHLLPILPSLTGCVLPYCVRKEGDPASLPRMVTPPQLVTSKRGHCSFCAPLLLNSPKEKLFAWEMITLMSFYIIGWILGDSGTVAVFVYWIQKEKNALLY